jgi:cell division GTPase FtsZ
MDKKTTLLQAYRTSDHIMLEVIHSLIDLLLLPGRPVPGVEEIRAHIPHRDMTVVTAG